jgi:hypothetical protein
MYSTDTTKIYLSSFKYFFLLQFFTPLLFPILYFPTHHQRITSHMTFNVSLSLIVLHYPWLILRQRSFVLLVMLEGSLFVELL